ncbi:MAG: hypothetical protein ACRD0Q_12005 [Acidimicrobiales bacterium]
MQAQPTRLAERRVRPPAGPGLDLSTGLNRYGPPSAVLEALHSLSPADLQIGPREAGVLLEAAYSEALHVDASELLVGRGADGFLRALARRGPVPVQAGSGTGLSLEQVDEAMDAAELVVVPNPHPSGSILDPASLHRVAERHPFSTLIVDETFVEFLPAPSAYSVVSGTADNVVALRSPSLFEGIGAARTGVAWARDKSLLHQLFGPDQGSSLSGLDVVVTEAALSSGDWMAEVRGRLAADGAWLSEALAPFGRVVAAYPGLPYRCVATGAAAALAAGFAGLGVTVGVVPGGLWVSAPRQDERAAFAEAVAAVASPAWTVAG